MQFNIGVNMSLYRFKPNNLASSKKSNTHFLRDKLTPFLDCATSIPNKYYKFPRSLVYNEIWRNSIISAIPFLSSPVIIISSILIFLKKLRNKGIWLSEYLDYSLGVCNSPSYTHLTWRNPLDVSPRCQIEVSQVGPHGCYEALWTTKLTTPWGFININY